MVPWRGAPARLTKVDARHRQLGATMERTVAARRAATVRGRRCWLLVVLSFVVAFAATDRVEAQDTLDRRAADVWLDINLPAYRLDVWEHDQLLRSMRIAIGAPAYPTPTGTFQITQLVWNPEWIPPASPWAKGETIMAPGPSNPMLKVKIRFFRDYFIHGTPLESSIGRAESHGCVRLRRDDAVSLARLLQEKTGADITPAATDSLIRYLQPTRTVDLPVAVQVRVRYDIAEVRSDTLAVFPDVYRRYGGQTFEGALRALAGHGIDTTRVRRDVLRSLVARVSRRPIRLPLSELIAEAPPR